MKPKTIFKLIIYFVTYIILITLWLNTSTSSFIELVILMIGFAVIIEFSAMVGSFHDEPYPP